MDKVSQAVKEIMSKGFDLAKSTPHDLFVDGVKNKVLNFEILADNKYKLLNKSHKIAFSIYVAMYMFVPIILISILSYVRGNWYILIGIGVCYLGSILGARAPKVPILLTLAGLGWWAASGFHMKSYPMFFLVCMWWGSMWYLIANGAETEYLNQDILTNPGLYNALVERDLLYLVIKPS